MSTAASGGRTFDRRRFLQLATLSAGGLAFLQACSKAGINIPRSLRAAARNASGKPDLQVFPGGQEFLSNRAQRLPFGVTDPNGTTILGPPARVWIGDSGSTQTGPFVGSLERFRTVEQPGDPAGFYVVTVQTPAAGLAWMLVETSGHYGISPLAVLDAPTTVGVGQRAVSVVTPTPGHLGGIARLCTRDPVCPMHAASLDAALRQHKAIVFTIASPLLCTSRTCGPVVDEVVDLHGRHARDAVFIHAEPYAGTTATALSPTAKAWRIPSEPWVWVIDRSGVVRARFEGPVVAAEIEPELKKVL